MTILKVLPFLLIYVDRSRKKFKESPGEFERTFSRPRRVCFPQWGLEVPFQVLESNQNVEPMLMFSSARKPNIHFNIG